MKRYAFVIIALLSFSCGPIRRIEPDNLFWPMPPDTPRIKYLQSIYNEDDIGRDYSLKERLFGKEYVDSLARPYGVYGRRGRLYVTDTFYRAVFAFDLAAKRLSLIGAEGAMQVPSSASSDAEGNVYVADPQGGKVVVYDSTGKYSTAYSLKGGRPVAVAVNASLKRLYVVDNTGHRVVVLRMPDGEQISVIGERGKEDGRFNLPIDITVDAQGAIYVLDGGNFRVQIFDKEGKFRKKFGSVGDRPGLFARPKGIAVDSDGHIYVTDAAFNNFQIFDQEGNALLAVGSLGAWPGQMNLPAGISIDEYDRIFVADQFNRRIQVFQYIKTQ